MLKQTNSLFDRPDVDLLKMLCQQSTSVGRIARGCLALAHIERRKHTSPETYCELRALVLKNLEAALNEAQITQ